MLRWVVCWVCSSLFSVCLTSNINCNATVIFACPNHTHFLFPEPLSHTAPCGCWGWEAGPSPATEPEVGRALPLDSQPGGQDSASVRLTLQPWDWISRGLCKDAGPADKPCPWCSQSASPWPGVSMPAALSWSHSSCCPSFLGFDHCPSPVAQTSSGALCCLASFC